MLKLISICQLVSASRAGKVVRIREISYVKPSRKAWLILGLTVAAIVLIIFFSHSFTIVYYVTLLAVLNVNVILLLVSFFIGENIYSHIWRIAKRRFHGSL